MTNDSSKKDLTRRALEAIDSIERQFKREEFLRHVRNANLATDEERFLDQLSGLIQSDLEDEQNTLAAEPAAQARVATSVKSFTRRLEELGRGIISVVAGEVAEFQMQTLQAASGFRRSSHIFGQEEGLAAQLGETELPDVVNWVPGNISSTVVGCLVSLVWKGSEAPSKRPNLRVFYDGEPTSFEEETKGARTIEISIDQPKPSHFAIEVSDAGEYVINLYSS